MPRLHPPSASAVRQHIRQEFVGGKNLPLWAMALGLFIFMGLGFLRFSPYVQNLENEGIDRVMQWSRPYGLEKQNPVALVEIDQETYLRWGEPTRLPHDRLASVLEGLMRYQPKIVVFDFDLAAASQNTPRASDLYAYLGTDRLEQSLRQLSNKAGAPKLILVRTFSYREGRNCVRYAKALDTPAVFNNPNIAFAAPIFLNQGVVRFWQFSSQRSDIAACGEVSKGVLAQSQTQYPSVQLLLLWLEQGLNPQELITRLQTCPHGDACTLRLHGHTLHLQDQQTSEQRVIYSLPWGSNGGAVRYPAWAIENPSSYSAWPPLEALRDRVVFVGSSFQPSEDWHRTSLGPMPGVWVLINAYYSLRDAGQLRPLGWAWRLLLGIGLLGIYSLLRKYLKMGYTRRFMGYVFLGVAVYVGTLFSQQALWMDVVLMIFALQLMERAVSWAEARQKAKTAKQGVGV